MRPGPLAPLPCTLPRVAIGILILAATSPAFAQPVYDDCATPIQIVNFPQDVPFDTTNATPTAALTSCPNMGGDLWYMVVAPIDGLFVLSHDFNPTQHAIYRLPGGPGSGCPIDADQLYCDSPTNQNQSYTDAVVGETYLVRVSGFQGGNVSGTLTFDFLPPPLNDDCAAPQVLNLPDVVAYDSTGATPTAGLPCAINRDIWYTVTPTVDGLISVNANPNNTSTAFGVDVAVYAQPLAGGCPTALEEIACNGTQSVSFPALGGETYFIQVGMPFGDGFAAALLSIDQTFAPPPGDECTAPEATSLPATIVIDTTGATPDATGLLCNANDDVWYSFVAPGDGQVEVQLAGVGLRHQLYHLPFGVGTCPTEFDAISPCWGVNQSWSDIVSGETYVLRIGSDQPGPNNASADLAFVAAIANDTCPQALPLAVPSVSPVTTLGATPDGGGLGCTSNDDSWYSLVAPTTGLLHLEFDDFTGLAIYDAASGCPAPATELFCDDIIETILPVTAGQEFLLRIAGFNAFPPVDTTLSLEILQPAPNDDCAAPSAPIAISLPTPTAIAWDNTAASTSVTANSCAIARDLWYSFLAPSDGCVRFESTIDGEYAIHVASAGGGCPTGPPIACVGPTLGFPDRIDFPVIGGTTYLVQVGAFGNGANPLAGEFTIAEILCDPENVVCDGSTPDQVTVTFDIPSGTSYDLGTEVRLDGAFVATLPPGVTTYTELLPTGFTGVVRVGVTGLSSTLGSSGEVGCASAFGAVSNDLCTGALPVVAGANIVDLSIALLDPSAPATICSVGDSADVWYSFTAPISQLYTFGICSANFTARLDLFDATGGCPTSASTPLACTFPGNCSTEWFIDAGETVFIRVVARDFTFGTGTLDIAANCPALSGLSCTHDCVAGTVTLTWNGGQHDSYDIVSSSGSLALGLTVPTFTVSGFAGGSQSFEVIGNCPNGSSTSATCQTFVVDPTPADHIVLALESVGTGGGVGAIDSASAIAGALSALGEDVNLVVAPDFDQDPCIPDLLAAAESIWVMAGTSPASYSLSVAERDLLASVSLAGAHLYLEGADLWGNAFGTSALEERDGVEANLGGNIDDGDDSCTAVDGLVTSISPADFTTIVSAPYLQDSPGGDDRTDRLRVSGSDLTGMIPPDSGIAMAEAFLVNADDSGTGEPAYIVGILAVPIDGGRVIASSIEFGGFSGDPLLLLEQYLVFFEAANPPVGPTFRRGDVNGDQTINIADPIFLLRALFPPPGTPANEIACAAAADANLDGGVNIADAVRILEALFVPGSSPIDAPSPECGTAADGPVDPGTSCDMSTCP